MADVFDEQALSHAVDILIRLVEAAGALIIFVGAMTAFVRFAVVSLRHRSTESFVPVRLGLGRFLALGLEFQLASDILRTAIAPTMREIAELAAVAAIRTVLNLFLNREIKQEEREEAARRPQQVRTPADVPAPASGGS